MEETITARPAGREVHGRDSRIRVPRPALPERKSQSIAALAVVAAVLVAGAIGLAPELTITRVDLNDNVFHFGLIQGMVQAIEHHRNPFDWWAPSWVLGYPVLRTYQPLAHAIVVLTYFALGKTVSLITVFVWVRYLSVLLLPLTFYATARLLQFPPGTAAAAAVLSPLVSTPGLYGIEYGSYLWAGSGLFTQAVACHFFLLTVGFSFRAIREGRRLVVTGALLGLTFLAHFIYGYMAAVTVCLLGLVPNTALPRMRGLRVVWIGAVAFALASFQLLPLILDGSFINHSRWEASWKWDSFGAAPALKWLFTGELLDHGRFPVLSLLALLGATIYFWGMRTQGERTGTTSLARRKFSGGSAKTTPALARSAANIHDARCASHAFVILAAAFWILIFFGRPFWGPVLTILGVSGDLQLHRVIGGAQVFLVLLAAIGLSGMWRFLSARAHVGVALIATAILLYPAARERTKYLSNNSTWGHASLSASLADKDAIDTAVSQAKARGGRAYAGLAASWGGRFKIGDLPFYAYLSLARTPALSFMYHSMSLTSEIMTRFNEQNPDHYRLFNIQTVVAPVRSRPDLPRFLDPIAEIGPFQVLGAPGGGYCDVVDARYSVRSTRNNFYDVNDRWLQSDWVGRRQHLILDFSGDASPEPTRLPDDSLPPASTIFPPDSSAPGAILSESQSEEEYDAVAKAARPSFVLFKITWHPNWRARIDGHPIRTVMLSPGFIGVPIGAGQHRVQLQYEPGRWRTFAACIGFLIVMLIAAGERGGYLRRMEAWFCGVPLKAKPVWIRAAGIVTLSLPVCVALFTSALPAGHDATEYVPRLVEFHANISHGVLLPRWAPDLANGSGEPLFIFNPPAIYYLGEFWHVLGFSMVTSLNLACVMIVFASAAGMFLFGRLYFGDWGGWLAAAAYLYAPYFSANLYVRSAMSEFAAFAFFPFALYGFGAYARCGRLKHLWIGAASYAGVFLSHNPAALFFTPLLVAFVLFTAWIAKSWSVLRHQVYGLFLGLGLAACVWLPSLLEKGYVNLDRLLQGYLRYSNHFVYVHQLLYSSWGYGLSQPGDQDGMSFAIGWSHLVLVALVCFWIVSKPQLSDGRWLYFFAVAALILSALMLEDSAWVWDRIPLLQYVEFPWRILGTVSVCVAAMVASLGPLLQSLTRWRKSAFVAAMALLIVPNLPHLHPNRFLEMDPTFWTRSQIASRGVEVTTAAEYTPRWIHAVAPYSALQVKVISGDAELRPSHSSPVSWSGALRANAASMIELPIAYFPGWQVRVDRQPVRTRPSPDTGRIRFETPAGYHRVDIAWTRTAAAWAGDGISCLSLLVILAAAGYSRFSIRRSQQAAC